MGLEVKITTPAGFAVQVAAARRRAVVKGGNVILAKARAAAPRDTEQMISEEHSRARLDMSEGGERAEIAFDEVYSVYQEGGEHYDHPHGGGPHFLENALIHGHEEAFGVVAAEIARSLGHG